MPSSTSVWNIISIGGKTMRQAVDEWWAGNSSSGSSGGGGGGGGSSSNNSSGSMRSGRGSGAVAGAFTTDCVWHGTGKEVFCNPVCQGFPYY